MGIKKNAYRDVVVLIPGICGSVLKKDGKDIWAISGNAIGQGLLSLGRSVKDLALDGDDPNLDDLGDGVTPDRLIQDVTIIPWLWSIDGYGHIAERLCRDLALTPGENYFEFPYDWRRDNRVAARNLSHHATEWLHTWRKKTNNPQARLNLIAHSMGGLVSRYFIEVLEGWRITRNLITIGTPHRGSVKAVDFIANGLRKTVAGLQLVDLSKLLRSFTSVYQLLPIYPCIDGGDGKIVKPSEQEIPDLDLQRTRAADAFYREIESAVAQNLSNEEYLNSGCQLIPIVGTFQPTLQAGKISGNKIELYREHPQHNFHGDGTVPQVSAYPIEWDVSNPVGKNVVYATERHSSLQNDNTLLANMVAALGGFDIDLGAFRGPIGLSLDIEDVFSKEEPVSFKLSSDKELRRFSLRIENIENNVQVLERQMNARKARSTIIEVGALKAGTYRLSIQREAVGRVKDTVNEVFLVLPIP